MHKEKIPILGISLGTRQIGIGLMQDGELIDWRIKVFRGKWSEKKLATILRYFERLVHIHNIRVIALKLPTLIKSSVGLQELITQVKETFKQKKLKVCVYTINDIKAHHFPHGRTNKKALLECVAEKFPEVYLASKKEKSNRNPHYIKMFEAISAAQLQCQKIQQQHIQKLEKKALRNKGEGREEEQ